MGEHRHGTAGQALGWIVCTAFLLTTGHSGTARASAGTRPISCNGPRDLIVAGGRISLEGAHSFERVCIQSDGILGATHALTLRVGTLYIAPGGLLTADGEDGHIYDTHDCINDEVVVNGGRGGVLTIIARRAIIGGRISANGGHGLDNAVDCGSGQTPIGRGGDGGEVLVEAESLSLHGSVTADGGDGGAAIAGDYAPISSARSGGGGRGGKVVLATASSVSTSAAVRAHVHVDGGRPGARGRGAIGSVGGNGTMVIRALSGAERAALPPPPAPLMTILAPPLRRTPLDARFSAIHRMGCGPGDLHVRSGQLVLLSGTHQYRHVCIDTGGHIMAYPHLTLSAQTIAVAPGAIIEADGDGPSEQRTSVTGRYEAEGACRADRSPPHAGVPGPASTYGDMVAYGGGGGGMIILKAQAILLAGTLSVNGSTGADGADVDTGFGGTFPAYVAGGGGGSGGGVLVAARDIQLPGSISAVGGSGGLGENSEQAAGMHGGPGCIKLFTDSLQARSDSLPFVGPAVIGRL